MSQCSSQLVEGSLDRGIARFKSHVDRSSGLNSCWLWTAFRDKRGYGTTYWRGKRGLKAHRVAYEIAFGLIPAGLFVIHSCDNPSCCNPAHLRVGTPRDNARDMVSRGRQARGERNGQSKLSISDVLKIRRLVKVDGVSQTEAASTFGVTQQHVSLIVNGVNWTHI